MLSRPAQAALETEIANQASDATTTLYALDAVGNRTGERRAPSARVAALTAAAFFALAPADALADVTAVFNNADWLTSTSDVIDPTRSRVYEYDLNGNLVLKNGQQGTREFRWDVRNTLTAVVDGSVTVGRYDYDWRKLRVRRTTAGEDVAYALAGMFLTGARPAFSNCRT